MEIEAEAGGLESNECKTNLELGDKQKKKRKRLWKKKRQQQRRQANELKNNDDSNISSQNGNADEAVETEKSTGEDQVLSTLPSEPCQRDPVSCEEPEAALHHQDSISRKDSVPDANCNGGGKRRSKRLEKIKKKKEDSSREEKMLEDAEKTTNEDQDSGEKPGAAQTCTGPDLLTREDLRQDATNVTCSKGKKRKKEKDRNAQKESGVDINSTNAQVAAKCDIVSEPEGSKLVNIEEETGASVVITSCLKSKDDTVEQLEGTEVELNETVSQTQSPKAKKKKKRKKRRTKTMEVCDPLGNTLASKIEDSATEEDTLQNVENTKKKKKNKKKKVDQDALGTEGVSIVEVKTTEDSATEGKSTQNVKNAKTKKKDTKVNRDALEAEGISKAEEESIKNDQVPKKRKKDKKGEVDQEALEAGVSKIEVEIKKSKKKKKGKKKKSSIDHKSDNMEEKDDVILSRNDEELDINKENLETSLSSTVVIHNNVAEAVAPPEIGDVTTCSCTGQRTKKLIVFDLNGILADIVQGLTGEFIPDGRVSYRSVFLRPFVHSFLDFCFERFDIGIWSSRRIGLDYMTNLVMKNHARNLLFCFGQNICTTTTFKTLENSTKPLFLKDLRKVWERFGTCLTCGKRKYDETNTLLVDDSPEKSLCNPPHTGIFPRSYEYTDREDSALGPEGELRKYLERLADAASVQKFVAENPYGQAAITETHESWEFYSKVFEAYSVVN